jgi:hypothetical protein
MIDSFHRLLVANGFSFHGASKDAANFMCSSRLESMGNPDLYEG